MSKKILVIDDEELIVRTLTKLFKKSGFEPFVVKSGQEAMVSVKKEKFDLIISDMRIPGISGVDVVKMIGETLMGQGIKPPPVIFITGYADEECEKKAKELNPAAYIYKPFNISDLLDKVNKVFKV